MAKKTNEKSRPEIEQYCQPKWQENGEQSTNYYQKNQENKIN